MIDVRAKKKTEVVKLKFGASNNYYGLSLFLVRIQGCKILILLVHSTISNTEKKQLFGTVTLYL